MGLDAPAAPPVGAPADPAEVMGLAASVAAGAEAPPGCRALKIAVRRSIGLPEVEPGPVAPPPEILTFPWTKGAINCSNGSMADMSLPVPKDPPLGKYPTWVGSGVGSCFTGFGPNPAED